MSETKKALDDLAVECGAASMVSPYTHPNGPRTAVKFKLDDGSLERFASALAQRAGSGAQAINPPEFPKYPAGITDKMPHEHLWAYACLTGWRAGHFAQLDSERDAARINFHLEYDTTWYEKRGKNGNGILCYGFEGERQEVQAATWREAIDAAMAAQQGAKGGA